MSWILITLASSILAALVSIFDKIFIYRFAQSSKVLPLLVGILQTSLGLALLIVLPIFNGNIFNFSNSNFLSGILFASLSGILFGISGNIMIRILHTNEVSRIVPITQTYPLFTIIIAYFLFNESIDVSQWIAILFIIFGLIIISINPFSIYNESKFKYKIIFLLILGSFFMSLAYATTKMSLAEIPVILAHALRELFLGLIFLLFNLRKETFSHVRELWNIRSPGIRIVGFNELLNANVALLLMVWALSLGPVSLVSTISSSRILFVVIIGLIVEKFSNTSLLGEKLDRNSIITKLLGALLIVIGIIGISLNQSV